MVDITLLTVIALVTFLGFEYVQQTDDGPFEPVDIPFADDGSNDLEQITCHPRTHASGFKDYLVWYDFRVKKQNKSSILLKPKHEWWSFGGVNFFDCLSQLQEDIRKINQPADWSPNTWCLAHCWEYSRMDYGDGSSDNKNLKLVNKQTSSSTLATPAFCTRDPWIIQFPGE